MYFSEILTVDYSQLPICNVSVHLLFIMKVRLHDSAWHGSWYGSQLCVRI